MVLLAKVAKEKLEKEEKKTRSDKFKKMQQDIDHEMAKEKAKKIGKKLIKNICFVVLFFTGLLLYARYIATSGLLVKEVKVNHQTLPKNFDGLKVVQFTDLHYGSSTFLKEVKSLVKKINQTHPDIVVFTGDLIDKEYSLEDDEIKQIANALDKIEARLGKYAVKGNHDYQNDFFTPLMEQSHFTILNNQYELIYQEEDDPILIVGLESMTMGQADINKAYSYFEQNHANKNIYTITIFHEPDYLEEILKEEKCDLALAGHSHNGQVRLPFLGAIVKVRGARKYDDPYYRVNATDLFVSGGIGTSNYPIRLFNHPSINFLRVVNEEKKNSN